ncbi:MAG TPA: helix-turn-helix transcriptional regulator [Pirellulales bacterium]|nr:helix-turn-helix transcriptional regulator [Pirellulales bacterium]
MDSRLLSGMVDTLLLEVISDGATYGYEIAQTMLARSRGYFEITEGSLYPALHRLERQKYLESFWQEADGRERKYYRLTPAGRRALAAKKKEWQQFVTGAQGILGGADGVA